MEITCSGCARQMIQDAAAEALRAEPIERPAWDRRYDFMLRLVVAFYPHGATDEVKGKIWHFQALSCSIGWFLA